MEKYGTIPPKFTKDWWIHYWTYYKLHFLLGTFLFFAVVHLIYTNVTAVNHDLKIKYLTTNALIPTESLTILEEKATEVSGDVTNNKKTEVAILPETMPAFNDYSQAQMLQAVQARTIAELQVAENQIYIVDKAIAELLHSYQCMLPVTEWAGDGFQDKTYCDIALSLSEVDLFNDSGFNTSDLYMCVISPSEDCLKDKECVKKFENGKAVAKELIKGVS